MSTYCAKAPGKIILSGEHAVVYGAPALVVAVSKYTTVRFHPIHRSQSIRTAFKGLPYGRAYPLKALEKIKHKLDTRFEQFSRGELSVNNILRRPDDLAIYALATFFQRLPIPGKTSNRHLPMPGHLSSESQLPLGAGMGSSASAIAATIVLYEHLLERPLTLEQRFERIRFCERLQHGKGSSLDAAAVTYGGLITLQNGQVTPLSTPLDENWYWLLHGIPASSTGECVAQVRRLHGHDNALWQQFSACTKNLENALHHQQSPLSILRENHRLLKHIGITSPSANKLIQHIEAQGGGAKVSGAGTIDGEKNGIILAYHPDPQAIPTLMSQYPDLSWGKLNIAPHGASLCQTIINLEQQHD